MMVTALLVAATLTAPLRNPCWPVGYVGAREPILDSPKLIVRETAPGVYESRLKEILDDTADDELDAVETERCWQAARKSLKIRGRIRNGARVAITINDRIYVDGNLISVNHEGRRFTWRIANLSEGNLKLQRVRMRKLADKLEVEGR